MIKDNNRVKPSTKRSFLSGTTPAVPKASMGQRRQQLVAAGTGAASLTSFMVLIFLFWIDRLIIAAARVLPPLTTVHLGVMSLMNRLDKPGKKPSISRSDLIYLALTNMRHKKTRTMVTVGGMTLGIGAIVFLLSLGFGLQELVIRRVARLEEMRQTDVSLATGSDLAITTDTVASFAEIDGVTSVSPMIALVARASYQNSSTDMAAYGVTREYIEQSAIKPVVGELFSQNDIQVTVPTSGEDVVPQVEPVVTEDQTLSVSLVDDAWIAVRNQTDTNATTLGYTKSLGDTIDAIQESGNEYLEDQKLSNTWYKITVPIWSKKGTSYEVMRGENDQQLTVTGYVTNKYVVRDEPLSEGVLSEAVKTVDITDVVSRQVVINRAAMSVLGLTEQDALHKKVDLSFVATGELLEDRFARLRSVPVSYEIIGITPDDETPVMYVPFIDLRHMGINQFSQVKVTVDTESMLARVRDHIENNGYVTRSVSDTVTQINALFSTARVMLGLVGAVALIVASLGMFNTLTVSLLERTREVGLMKAMGIKSSEVRELFLAESVMMASLGGFLGLTGGLVAAKILEVVISIYTLIQGVGYLTIASAPPLFILLIIVIAFGIGLVTGFFPARRSAKISALNALRYE